MKKIIGLILIAVLGNTVTVVYAAQNDYLSNDRSVQQYERKVQLQLNDMGVASRKATLPVTYCGKPDKDKKRHCFFVGKWDFSLSQALENKAAAVLLGRLSGKRFDILKIGDKKLSLKTLSETIETDSKIKAFNFGAGSFSYFEQSVDRYLNSHVASLMMGLLSKANDARYREMKDKERDTFLATIAKEQSVPVKFIKRLMGSAFVYAVYAESPRGNVTISHVTRKKQTWFNANVSINLKTHLVLYRFNANRAKFELYKKISESSGIVSASSHSFPYRPRHAAGIIAAFDDSYVVAAKASGIALNITLKEDDNFAILATIDELSLPEFKSTIGENEDLRVDAPYKVYQYLEGKKTEVGWGKARTVASSQTFRTHPADYKSQFDLMRGDAEFKDQLREHPWSGAFWFAAAGTLTINLDSLEFAGKRYRGGGTFTGLYLGIQVDLGYLFNAESFSEVWFEARAGAGVGGESIKTNSGIVEWEMPLGATYGFDVFYRYHLGSWGLYLGGKLGVGGAFLSATNAGAGDDLRVFSRYGVDWGLRAGYLLSPDTEIFVNMQGLLPLAAEAQIGDSRFNAQLSGGVDFSVGFAVHFKSIAGLARLMK